jgi:hypothetical protein
MLRIKHFGFAGIQIILMVKVNNFFFQILIEPLSFHVIWALIGISK